MLTSKEFLAMLKSIRKNFWHRHITFDKTWIHNSTAANKVMISVFWEIRGIIHVNNLEKGTIINRENHTNSLNSFNSALKEKVRIWPRVISSFHKKIREHLCCPHGKIQLVWIRIAFESTIFSRFSMLRLFPISQYEKQLGKKRRVC